MKAKFIIIMLFMYILITAPVFAITGAIGNARMILYPEVDTFGTTIEKYILVKNVNNVSINVTLTPSEEIDNIIKMLDQKFVLEPGEDKKAAFLIKLKKAGDYDGRISVFFSPAETDGKDLGVVLTSTIIIHAEKKGFWDNDDDEDDSDSNDVDDNVDNMDQNDEERSLLIPIILSVSTLILALALLSLILILNKKKRG